MLEERDEVGGDGEHLAGRDVHEVDVRDLDLRRSAKGAIEVARTGDDAIRVGDVALGVHDHKTARLGVNGGVGRRDVVVLLLVGGHPHDLVGDLAVDDLAIRSLDEAVAVHVRIERQRTDEADVGSLGGLDGAHAGVVRVVDVADGRRHVGTTAGARLVAGKAAGAQGREATLVREPASGLAWSMNCDSWEEP